MDLVDSRLHDAVFFDALAVLNNVSNHKKGDAKPEMDRCRIYRSHNNGRCGMLSAYKRGQVIGIVLMIQTSRLIIVCPYAKKA